MAILGKPSVNLAEILRQPPDATSGKATARGTPTAGFRRVFQQVRASRGDSVREISATPETTATARARAPAEAGPNVSVAATPDETRAADPSNPDVLATTPKPDMASGSRRLPDAEVGGLRVDPSTAAVEASTSTEDARLGERVIAAVEAAGGNIPIDVPETTPEGPVETETSSAEASAWVAVLPSVVDVSKTSSADGASAIASTSTVEPPETTIPTVLMGSPMETTPVDPSIVAAGAVGATAVESISQPTAPAPPSGKDFPVPAVHRENISTANLLRALEREVAASDMSEPATAWRRQLFVDGGEPLDPVALAARSGADAREVLSAVALARAEAGNAIRTASDPRMLGSELLAAGRRGRAVGLGTLHARNLTRSTDMPLRGVGSTWREAGTPATGRAWFGSEAAPTRTSVDAARTAIQRRAASAAFANTRTSLFRQAVDVGAGRQTPSQAVDTIARQNARTIDAASASFVRSQRMRAHGSARGAMSQMSADNVRVAEPVAQAAAGTPTPTGSSPTASASQATTTAQQVYSPLMEFIANETRRQLRLGKREFRIQLNPESLGSVELEVVIEGNALVVRLKAASTESQRILEDNIDDLETALAERGMTLDVETPWKDGRLATPEAESHAEKAVV